MHLSDYLVRIGAHAVSGVMVSPRRAKIDSRCYKKLLGRAKRNKWSQLEETDHAIESREIGL